MQTTTTQSLKFFRFRTPQNNDGWLIVAEDVLMAIKLFNEAYPNNKTYVVSAENKGIDELTNLN